MDSETPPSASSAAKPGAKAIRFPFTAAQEAHIDGFIPDFEQQVRTHDPGFKGHNKDVTAWKTTTAQAILNHNLFKDLPDKESRKDWRAAIVRRFGNHFGNKMKKHKSTSSTPIATPSRADGISKLIRSQILLTGEYPAQQYFVLENEAEITRRYQDLAREENIPGGGARNRVIKEMWEEEVDQEVWTKMAETAKKDIESNQKEYPLLVNQVIQDIAERDIVGSMISVQAWAFRAANGGIITGLTTYGYDARTKKPIEHEVPGQSTFLDSLMGHADLTLPRVSLPTPTTLIQTDKMGIPLFPAIDFMTAAPPQLVQVITDYFAALWSYSWPPDQEMPSIPWADIATSPAVYYDTSTFILPTALTTPELYSTNPGDLYSLAAFLLKTSASALPFQFRSREEILRKTLEQCQAFEDDRTAGDDLDHGMDIGEEPRLPMGPSTSVDGSAGTSSAVPAGHSGPVAHGAQVAAAVSPLTSTPQGIKLSKSSKTAEDRMVDNMPASKSPSITLPTDIHQDANEPQSPSAIPRPPTSPGDQIAGKLPASETLSTSPTIDTNENAITEPQDPGTAISESSTSHKKEKSRGKGGKGRTKKIATNATSSTSAKTRTTISKAQSAAVTVTLPNPSGATADANSSSGIQVNSAIPTTEVIRRSSRSVKRKERDDWKQEAVQPVKKRVKPSWIYEPVTN
ncbi:hypothetical protein FPV67DRAFT_1445570 [Lyophyllum atratum]|nr:hypothetical protein FPV67DRAFT_1445570 [Lyophyllum atratum]